MGAQLRRPAGAGSAAAVALTLLVVALAAGLAIPDSVRAHAELVSASPGPNATLVEPPRELTLTFSEPVDAASLRIRLLDPQQGEVLNHGALSLDAAGTTVSISLEPLEPGIYTVEYQVTSAVDGHVTTGVYAFLLDPSGTEPAPALPTTASSPSSDLEVVASRWIALAAALALGGILIFWIASAGPVLAGRPGPGTMPPSRVIATLALLAAAALAAHLLLAARPIVDAGDAAGWFPLDPVGPFGWTPFAIAMRVALAGFLGAALLAAAGPVIGVPDRWWLSGVAAAWLVGLAGMSMSGHVAAAGGPLFAVADLAHLVGVAAWLGSLVGALLLLRRAREAVPAALRRHSSVALVAAPLVVLTGIAGSPLVLGDEPRELLASGYGNLLLAKAVLASAALGLGAVNFVLLRRRGGGARALRLVAIELAVAVVAVLAAAGMVTGQPAAGRAGQLGSTAIGTAHLYGRAGASTVHAAVNPPAPGEQRYQVSVADAATGAYRTDVLRVALVLTPPRRTGLAPERVQLEQADEPWLFGTTGDYTRVIGEWRVEVIVRRIGQLDERATFDLPVIQRQPAEELPPPDEGVRLPGPLTLTWRLVPPGGGWVLLGGLFAMSAGLCALSSVTRRRRWDWLPRLRTATVVATLLYGLAVGSRALVDAANAAPVAAVQEANPVESTVTSVDRGRALYLANCSACHGPDGAGDGPAADGWLTLRPLSEITVSQTDGALAYRISVGTAGTQMPAFAASLSPGDRWDLVNYLRARWPR